MQNANKAQQQEVQKNAKLIEEHVLDNGNKEYTDDSDTIDYIRKTLDNVGKRKGAREKLREQIIRTLIESECKDVGANNTVNIDDSSLDDLTDSFFLEIDNYSLKLHGKTNRLQFHPLVMRLCTNVYMTSPSAYMDLQKNHIYSLPSESTLKKNKSAWAVQDGKCSKIYIIHKLNHDANVKDPDQVYSGHLECNKFKLKSGIWWRTRCHEVIGFADDVNSFDEIIHHFLEDAEGQGPTNKLTTYVNQWIYRSSCGMTFPCEFFYNSSQK